MPSPRALLLVLALLAAPCASINGTIGRDFAYFTEASSTQTWTTAEGVVGLEWPDPDNHTNRNDVVLFPPTLSQISIPVGASFPSTEYYLDDDAAYVVIAGNATFGASPASGCLEHGYGDVFWVMAGHEHGPIVNVGIEPLLVDVVSGAQGKALNPQTRTAPDDSNPSVDSSLITSRSYRRVDGGAWSLNPSEHTDECVANGDVWNMAFDSDDNSPCVLRVKWGANCSIPYHYHPTGALYFILYGEMFFAGDVPADDPLFELALNPGEVRWVRPGFDYGPEYNGAEEMEITVLGTDTNPEFDSPPAGRYLVQKPIVATHVYASQDEL